MKSAQRGRRISSAEVTNVSPTGVWVLVDQREIFLAFTDFPWFADATIRQISQLDRPSPHHLYWPALDVDLALESLEDPAKYPLVSKARSNEPEILRRSKPPSV